MTIRLLIFAIALAAASAAGVLSRAEGAIMTLSEEVSADSGGMGATPESASNEESSDDPLGDELHRLSQAGLPGPAGGAGTSTTTGAGSGVAVSDAVRTAFVFKPGISCVLRVVDPLGISNPALDGLLEPPRLIA